MGPVNDDGRYLDLLTNLKALELVVSAMFTESALKADDPRATAFRTIEGLIGAMREIRISDAEAYAVDYIEDHLRAFLKNVDVRLEEIVRK
jgi:hypothetical protein